MEQGVFAEGELLEKLAKIGFALRPALTQLRERSVDLRWENRAGGFVADPIWRRRHWDR